MIERITYLLFLRRLDDLHTLEENRSTRLKRLPERRVFPEGRDERGRDYQDFRRSGEIPECIHQNHVFRVWLTNAALDPLFLNRLGSMASRN